MQIKLAESDPLEVDAGIVRRASGLAEGLPEGATEWDLSGLTLDGQPFDKDTVVQWLNYAYTFFGEYGDDDRFDSTFYFGYTARALYMLLAFSDAVLSRKGIFTACLELLKDSNIKTKLGTRTVFLKVGGGVYVGLSTSEGRYQLTVTRPTDAASHYVSQASSEEEWNAFVEDVALQAEGLMYIGHKLKLQPLIQIMHQFLHTHCIYNEHVEGLLLGSLGLVLSDRVVDAGLGSSSMTKQEWVHSILTQPCGLLSGAYGHDPMLEPDVDSVSFRGLTLHFTAALLKDYAGSKEGTKVDVKLKLFGPENPEMFIGGVAVPVQLCIGHGITDQDDLERVTGSR